MYVQENLSITTLKGRSDGGLCGQVVLIQKCSSITEVAHGAACGGHYRQVVFKYKWFLRQVSLYVPLSAPPFLSRVVL